MLPYWITYYEYNSTFNIYPPDASGTNPNLPPNIIIGLTCCNNID